MTIEALSELGLKDSEIAVYLAVLELGKTKSGPIVQKTKLHPSVVFLAIHTLTDKGLINAIKTGNHSQYAAANPSVLLDIIESKKNKIEKAMPSLLARQAPLAAEGAEMYEGIKGIQTLFFTMIAQASPGDTLYYFDAEEHQQEERAALVYQALHARAKEKGIRIKGIQRQSSQTAQIYADNVELRVTATTIPPDTTIFNDKLALISWSESAKGFLITSQQLADQYLRLWKELWKTSKPGSKIS